MCFFYPHPASQPDCWWPVEIMGKETTRFLAGNSTAIPEGGRAPKRGDTVVLHSVSFIPPGRDALIEPLIWWMAFSRDRKKKKGKHIKLSNYNCTQNTRNVICREYLYILQIRFSDERPHTHARWRTRYSNRPNAISARCKRDNRDNVLSCARWSFPRQKNLFH